MILMEAALCIIVALLIALNCYVQSNDQLLLLKGLIDTGNEMCRIGVIGFQRKSRYYRFVELVLSFLCAVYPFWCNGWSTVNFLLYSGYFMHIVFSNTNLSFTNSICFVIFARLKCINEKLSGNIQRTNKNSSELILLINLHGKLCEIISKLSSCYGPIAIFTLTFSCYAITRESFSVYVLAQMELRLRSMSGYILWILLHFFHILVLCTRSNKLKDEVNLVEQMTNIYSNVLFRATFFIKY